MNLGSPRGGVMVESSCPQGPQRRRSPRFGSPQESHEKMALGVKRCIVVKKIAPRKTAAASGRDKENTPVRDKNTPGRDKNTPGRDKENTPGRSERLGRRKVPTPGPDPGRMPSPILPSSPEDSSRTKQPTADPEDSVWSQKVRRSYSRLSGGSLSSPGSGDTLFGFEMLKTPEVVRGRAERSLEASGSFMSLLETEEGCTEPDPNIPGVAVLKDRKKRRRRKVQQIEPAELDALAARMNAEFQEAEGFELVVE